MKHIFSTLLLVFTSSTLLTAQTLQKLADKAKQKAAQKIEQKVDKKVDDVLDGKGKNAAKNEKDTSSSQNDLHSKTITTPTNKAITPASSLKTYSKFDFIQGEKIIAFEDFNKEELGDFPSKWNTNASAEVVTVENELGKWMQISQPGVFIPEFIQSLPENFTLEYDLIVPPSFNYYSTGFGTVIAQKEENNLWDVNYFKSVKNGIKFLVHPRNAADKKGYTIINTIKNWNKEVDNQLDTEQFYANGINKVHVSIWRQNQRIRIYLNEQKVFDLPRALETNKDYNIISFSTLNFDKDGDKYLISNIRLAIGKSDNRNKFLQEGKYSTSAIQFKSNSDEILPISYGALKEMATLLIENPTMNIKIVGHTDNVGDDKLNQTLSEKRAISVKKILESEFNIDSNRMNTDGKGKSSPIDSNDNAEGKANNRRVEFIKL